MTQRSCQCSQGVSPCGFACASLLFQEPNLACICILDVYVAILHWLHFFVAVLPLLHSGSQCRHPQEIDTKMAEVRKFTRPWQLDHYSYHKHALQWHQASCTYANRLSYAHCSKNRTFLASAWLMFMLPSSLDCIVKVNVSSISKKLILGWLKFRQSLLMTNEPETFWNHIWTHYLCSSSSEVRHKAAPRCTMHNAQCIYIPCFTKSI